MALNKVMKLKLSNQAEVTSVAREQKLNREPEDATQDRGSSYMANAVCLLHNSHSVNKDSCFKY
jgi:hypothetical protein